MLVTARFDLVRTRELCIRTCSIIENIAQLLLSLTYVTFSVRSFKNGSLTRERIRDKCAEGSWGIFDQLLESTPRGNFGNMGLYFDEQEIIPFLIGDYRFNKAGDRVTKFTSLEVEVRALIEGQFIAKRAYAEDIGFKIGWLQCLY